MPDRETIPAGRIRTFSRRTALGALAALPCAGGAAAKGSTPPSWNELEGMRLGLMMLGRNVERAFARAGIPQSPRDLTLAQIAAIYEVLVGASEMGPDEVRRIEEIVRR